jgi:uncharacterized protein (TIGR02246 family)
MVSAATDLSEQIERLYRELLGRWNQRDAAGYSALFTEDGTLVGFDGSCVQARASIREHLGTIFAHHGTAAYVAKVREVRQLGAEIALLRGVAGMVPPGAADIKPEVNAVQGLIAVKVAGEWRVAHFDNTPAAFDGRPEENRALTAELRALVADTGTAAPGH